MVVVVERMVFYLKLVCFCLFDQKVFDGYIFISWLCYLVEEGCWVCYGDDLVVKDCLVIEFDFIEDWGFVGYFFIVFDIVEFVQLQGILCQGCGLVVVLVVCYVLGIIVVDLVFYGLFFERFLLVLCEEEFDIDVDFDVCCCEEVIQYVYVKYGRCNVVQVVDVIIYCLCSVVCDMVKVFGYFQGQ